jgi:hypothetical protein
MAEEGGSPFRNWTEMEFFKKYWYWSIFCLPVWYIGYAFINSMMPFTFSSPISTPFSVIIGILICSIPFGLLVGLVSLCLMVEKQMSSAYFLPVGLGSVASVYMLLIPVGAPVYNPCNWSSTESLGIIIAPIIIGYCMIPGLLAGASLTAVLVTIYAIRKYGESISLIVIYVLIGLICSVLLGATTYFIRDRFPDIRKDSIIINDIRLGRMPANKIIENYKRALVTDDCLILEAIAASPAAPSDILTELYQQKTSDEPNNENRNCSCGIRFFLARNRNTPERILAELSKSKDDHVAISLIINPSTPDYIINNIKSGECDVCYNKDDFIKRIKATEDEKARYHKWCK